MGKNKPNILFFFADDQRFDTISALGNPEIKTPTLDNLVKSGVTFINAHIPGGTRPAVCMPSRAMLHSGRTLFHIYKEGQKIPNKHITLGETLLKEGYNTFGIGKWHNGKSSYARSFNDGAEIFFGGMGDHWNVPVCNYDSTGRYSQKYPFFIKEPRYSNQITYKSASDHITMGKHSSELFADASIKYLNNYTSDKPFFMYTSLMAPHDPRTMPERFLKMYNPNEIPLPKNFMAQHPFDTGALRVRDELLATIPRDASEIKRHIAEYYAMISHLDYEFGRILKALKNCGKLENTIIIFSGDNGLAIGQHGLMGKQSLYEHSIRVPLIISGPGIPKNKIRDTFVYLLDIYPTICEIIGIPIPKSVEGISVKECLYDNSKKTRDMLYLAYADTIRGIKNKRYKLIEYVTDGNNATQLFDFKKDPLELNNLAYNPKFKFIIADLRKKLFKFRDKLDDTSHPFGKKFWKSYKNNI